MVIELNEAERRALEGLRDYSRRRVDRHCRLRNKNRSIGKTKLADGHDRQALLWLKRLLALATVVPLPEVSGVGGGEG